MKYAFLLALPFLGATAPGIIGVVDGDVGFDLDFIDAGTPLSAQWGLMVSDHFEWAIGTTAGASDIQPFLDVGTSFSATATATAVAGQQYFISVHSVDATGGIADSAISDGITALGPSSVTGSPTSGPAPLFVTFSAPALPGVVLYEWDFDLPSGGKRRAKAMAFASVGTDFVGTVDGNTTHTYTFPGTYDATLTLTHAGGEVKNVIVTVTVTVGTGTAPSVSLTADVAIGPAPLTVTFTAAVTTEVASYFWDVDGDGKFDASSDGSPQLVHTYREVGSFSAQVTVVGPDGAATLSAPHLITVDPPSAGTGDAPNVSAFNVTGGTFRTGEVIAFAVTADAGATGSIVSYTWDFDGNGEIDLISATGTATWQYEEDGNITAKVVVTDDEGLSTTALQGFTINLDPLVPRIWLVEPESGLKVAGNFVSITAQAVPADQVTGVTFNYRAVGANTWIPINAVPVQPPPTSEFGTHWDTTLLPAGPPGFELMASATFASPLGPADSAAILVVVQVDPVAPDLRENSGSPFTKLKSKGVDPNVAAKVGISRDATFKLQAGSTTGYDQMRIERRSENPHPVETTLQGLRFVPGHFRRQSFASGQGLQKPSKVSMYLNTGPGDILPDGTDLSTASYKLMRFNDAKLRWEPLYNQTFTGSQKLLKAFSASTGDVAIAIVSTRTAGSSSSSSGCGSLGLELVAAGLAAAALGRRLRRKG